MVAEAARSCEVEATPVTVKLVPVAFINHRPVAEAFATVSQPVLVAFPNVRPFSEELATRSWELEARVVNCWSAVQTTDEAAVTNPGLVKDI